MNEELECILSLRGVEDFIRGRQDHLSVIRTAMYRALYDYLHEVFKAEGRDCPKEFVDRVYSAMDIGGSVEEHAREALLGMLSQAVPDIQQYVIEGTPSG